MHTYLEKKITRKFAPLITSLGIQKIFSPIYSGKGNILMFHRVVPSTDGFRIHNHESLEITVQQLEGVIRFYKDHHFTCISLDQLPDFLTGSDREDRFVIFTFDDGYADNYEYAAPIFDKYEMPFTIYVTTDFPDRKAVLWWYYLEDILKHKEKINFTWNGNTYNMICDGQVKKEKLFYWLRNLLIQSAESHKVTELLRLLYGSEQLDPFEKTENLAMSWHQIREISTHANVTIAAHTLSHPPLSKMELLKARNEIVLSREKLEQQTGKPVVHFSYPFGSANEAGQREFDLVTSCGFRTATTTRFSTVHPEHIKHLAALPRITVNSYMNTRVLELCASGMLPAIRNTFRRVVIH